MSSTESAATRVSAGAAPGTAAACVRPASFAQQRLWFLDQWEPGSATYNITTALRLSGPLDVGSLERSLNAVVARHESLRTTFHAHGGEPVQVIAPGHTMGVTRVDLSELPESVRESELHELASREAHRPFDLTRGPLLRAVAVRLADEQHVLILTVHHIVFDGWSEGVLFRELAAHYNAFLDGTTAAVPPLPIQYAEYAISQRESMRGDALERQLAYWRTQLRGPLPVLELPLDHPRAAIMTSRGAQHVIHWPRVSLDRLTAVARPKRATLFMVLLAVFQALLARYTGQDDISVGTAIAGRARIDVEPLIGFFVNTLVLRTDLSGNPTFNELLDRVRTVAIAAYAHQDVPFEKLVAELHPERNLSHTPLCQAMFVLHHDTDLPDFRGLDAVRFEVRRQTTKFDVSVGLHVGRNGLRGSFTYSTDVFDASTIARMATHYETLLASIISDPNRPLSELAMLTPRERHRVVVEWNDTATSYPRDACAHSLFEAQAHRTPAATAVVCGSDAISYAVLNVRANQLARRLGASGVGRETPVAVCLPRSIDLIVALVAVLKAGAAYVPLDPRDPPERLRFMLADVGAPCLITDSELATVPPKFEGVERVDVGHQRHLLDAERADNLELQTAATGLAYVMYTSGSTGSPKAVSVVHRGIVRLVHQPSYASIRADDVVLQAAPVTFDASTFEIWGALLNGATLALAPADKPSLAELGKTIEQHRVTIAWFTSGLFSQMVDHEMDQLRRLRHVLAGGDVLAPGHVRTFLARAGATILTNGYGPTENTTFTCCHSMAAGVEIESSVPIGRPISNTEVYVLDAHLNPQPVGVPGELYVGGDGLARGYWNRPELTSARFIPHPFRDDPEARLYKTGDRVRYRSDGVLEFLGRVDRQVKISGYRIELEEIELHLTRHPAVREAVVVATDGNAGDKRLVAYVSGREPVAPEDLKADLARHLPDYMVPQRFVVLEKLPRTAAGKIDRHKLPDPVLEPRSGEPVFEARTDVERQLVEIWCGVLGVNRIGIHDDFFELGGHSLLATQVIARVRARYGQDLPVRAMFETPTVAGLAARLSSASARTADAAGPDVRIGPPSTVVPLQPRGTKTPFFCVHGIGGEVQSYAALARHLDPERPFFGLRFPQVGDDEFPTIEALASTYVKDVRLTQPIGPYLVGGYSSGATVAFEMAQQLQASGADVALIAALDSGLPNNRPGRQGPWLAAFCRNLWWWTIDDLLHAGRANMAARARSKITVFAAQLAARPGLRWLPHREPDIRDLLGIPSVPEEWSGFLAQHYAAFRSYKPRPFTGRVSLVRARALPLFRRDEPDIGWHRMAKGGVDLEIVPGTHETLLQEPNVQRLARVLGRALDAAQGRAR